MPPLRTLLHHTSAAIAASALSPLGKGVPMIGHDVVITRSGRRGERDALAQLLAEAFLPVPLTRWLLQGYECSLTDYMLIWVDHGFGTGTVEVAEVPNGEVAGVTIWWREPGPEPAGYAARLSGAVPPECLPRFTLLDAAMHAATPRREPGVGLRRGYACLGFAAVHPRYQRRGLDGVLLNRRHTDLDTTATSAHLLAPSPDARRLFLRHGYRDHCPPLTLPDAPPLYPMWRTPTVAA